MDSSDEDVPTCPLCMEELDSTDRSFKACQCGYQVSYPRNHCFCVICIVREGY